MNPQDIEIELGILEYPAFPAYIVRAEGLNPGSLGQLLADTLEEVFKRDLELLGPPTVNYVEIPPGTETFDNLTVEAAVPVDPDAASAKGLETGIMEGITLAASARFRGPHEAIPQIYAALLEFIKEQNYQVAGLPREHYWEHREDGQHLTELLFPVIDLVPEGQRQFEE